MREKMDKKEAVHLAARPQTVDNRPLFGGGCLFLV